MANPTLVHVAGQVPATADNPLGIMSLNLDTISKIPPAKYAELAGNFVNVQNAVYYDTAVYTAGTAITPRPAPDNRQAEAD